jgi:hypothetical protein
MKKKMLFMAALAGAVTLASCVKNDELASVQAVRTAKANKLNSEATLNEAQALYEAARAAFVTAQTATEQANAALTQANARIQAAQASLKEDALADELAAIKAQYQNTAADQAGKAAQELRDMAIDAQTDLATAIGVYQGKLGTYTLSQAAYVAAKVALETAKINPDYAKEQAALAIKDQENIIKENQLLIDALKNAEYSSMTPAELTAAQAAKDVELAQAINDFNSSEEVANLVKASKDFMDARDDYNDSKADITALNAKGVAIYTALKGVAPTPPYNVVDTDGDQVDLYPAETDEFWDYKTIVYDATLTPPAFDYTYISGVAGTKYDSTTPYKTDHFRLNDANNTELANLLTTDVDTKTKAYDEAVDMLGTEDDKPDTTTKMEGNGNRLTLYATLNGAKAVLADAEKVLAAAQKAYADEDAKLVQAYKDLAAAYALDDSDTTKAAKVLAAQTAIGDELVKIYGDYPTPRTIADGVDVYVFDGANTFAGLEAYGKDYTKIKQFVELYAILTRADDKLNNDYLVAKNAVEDTSVTPPTGAKPDVEDAQDNVAAWKDTIAARKTAKEKAESDKAAFEAAIAAVDVNGVNEAADKLADLMDAWDAARKAEIDAEDVINNLNAEIDALTIYQTATVISPIDGVTPITADEAIAEAEKLIADAKNAIAELNSSESSEEVITALENALADAEAQMKSDYADLAAAGAVVEALLEQMGLEPDDETGPLDGDDDDAVGPVEDEGGEG